MVDRDGGSTLAVAGSAKRMTDRQSGRAARCGRRTPRPCRALRLRAAWTPSRDRRPREACGTGSTARWAGRRSGAGWPLRRRCPRPRSWGSDAPPRRPWSERAHDQVTEARREALDLALDGRRHVTGRPGGDVAVAPEGVPTRRRPGRVGHPGLDHQAEGSLRVPAGIGVGLAGRHLFDGAADVHGPGCSAGLRRPRHRSGQLPVQLEDARPVPKAVRGPARSRGGSAPPARPSRPGRDIEHDGGGPGQFGQGVHPLAGGDRPPARPARRPTRR